MNIAQQDFQATHYALAWSFLHYLIKRPGKKNSEKFARFLRKTNGSGAKPLAEIFAQTTGEDFEALFQGWREHVKALPTPKEITRWVPLTVIKATEDIQNQDILWSMNGYEIYDPDQFSKLWQERPKDRPVELILIRCSPSFHGSYSKRWFVRTAIAPGSEISISVTSSYSRHANLRD